LIFPSRGDTNEKDYVKNGFDDRRPRGAYRECGWLHIINYEQQPSGKQHITSYVNDSINFCFSVRISNAYGNAFAYSVAFYRSYGLPYTYPSTELHSGNYRPD
jgi:hypothetical protein